MDYFPEVIPIDRYTVYVYFDDGSIKLYDANELITKGIFTPLQEIEKFKESCAVLNGTLAGDLDGNYDETTCLDIVPFSIYEECPEVKELATL